MANRSRRRRFTRQVRDLIWVTVSFDFLADDTLAGAGVELISALDWQPTIGVAFDRATLMSIRGWIGWRQAADATSVDRTMFGYALYRQATNFGAFILPTDVNSIQSADVLRIGGTLLATTLSGTGVMLQRDEIEVNVKRKISTDDSIYIAANVTPDTGNPTVVVAGILRLLIKTN